MIISTKSYSYLNYLLEFISKYRIYTSLSIPFEFSESVLPLVQGELLCDRSYQMVLKFKVKVNMKGRSRQVTSCGILHMLVCTCFPVCGMSRAVPGYKLFLEHKQSGCRVLDAGMVKASRKSYKYIKYDALYVE